MKIYTYATSAELQSTSPQGTLRSSIEYTKDRLPPACCSVLPWRYITACALKRLKTSDNVFPIEGVSSCLSSGGGISQGYPPSELLQEIVNVPSLPISAGSNSTSPRPRNIEHTTEPLLSGIPCQEVSFTRHNLSSSLPPIKTRKQRQRVHY